MTEDPAHPVFTVKYHAAGFFPGPCVSTSGYNVSTSSFKLKGHREFYSAHDVEVSQDSKRVHFRGIVTVNRQNRIVTVSKYSTKGTFHYSTPGRRMAEALALIAALAIAAWLTKRHFYGRRASVDD